ncbi:MAG TPA: crotonase/enoyl-CoA hydratase family protein [Stellaceae bacterium]|nr:crotonase/enoyl-CoA hydratase family protein [Stellaceae bacterium]
MSDVLTYELDGPVALIGLNRPDKRNAIDDALVEALRIAVARANGEAKVGLVFGHGAHFSAGLDLAEHVTRTAVENVHHSRKWHAIFDTIERGPIPYVSALTGAVVGGGMELAASAHIRVADDSAFFALPEGSRGIFVGGGGSVRVARLITAARMADMMLTGRVLSAAEGERAGFVQYLVPKGGTLAKAREVALRVARNAPLSNYAITNALPRIQDLAHDDGLFFESLMAAMTQTTPEAQERLREFLEKRAERLAVPGEDKTRGA